MRLRERTPGSPSGMEQGAEDILGRLEVSMGPWTHTKVLGHCLCNCRPVCIILAFPALGVVLTPLCGAHWLRTPEGKL